MKVAILLAICGCLHAQWLKQPTVEIPRTADGKADLSAPTPKTTGGKPDLSGLWTFQQTAGGIGQLKPDDIQPWARQVRAQRMEDLDKDSPSTLCLPQGFLGGLTKLIQTPGLVVLLGEDLTYRQVFLDGRELPKEPSPAFMGYSVGHWEGDTLVVESTGFNERVWLESDYPHTENLRMTERFHRRDFGHLDVEVTFSDPAIFAKPWSQKMDGLLAADTELLEFVCSENEKDRTHLVGKNSDETKKAVRVAPEILAKYVGTYEFHKEAGMPGPDIMEFKVAVEDGQIKMGVGDATKDDLTPMSETSFSDNGALIEFVKDDQGQVSHMMIRAVEGEFKANRKK